MKLTPQQNAFFQILSFESNPKNNRVSPSMDDKERMLDAIGSFSKNPLAMANRIIAQLIEKDLMRRVERGVYMLNPTYRDKQNSDYSIKFFREEYERL